MVTIRTGSARATNAVALCKRHGWWLSKGMRNHHKCINRDKKRRICEGYISLGQIKDPDLLSLLQGEIHEEEGTCIDDN